MRAMVMDAARRPLRLADIPRPAPEPGQVLIAVRACGVCRTDLHVLDGELPNPKLPLVLGHEIIGTVAATGGDPGGERFRGGQRVGVPWLGWSCGECGYCRSGRENLCDRARFTGYQIDGGYAEYTVADARFCFAVPDGYTDLQAAPLLCAGLIGYRSLVAAGDAQRLGLYGFGAAAHIVAQVAHPRVSLRYPLGRAGHSLRCEPDPERRRSISRARAQGPGAHGGGAVPARTRQRGTGEAEGGESQGSGGVTELVRSAECGIDMDGSNPDAVHRRRRSRDTFRIPHSAFRTGLTVTARSPRGSRTGSG